MSGMASVGRRATAGAGRSRRNMYSTDFESEPADQASGIPLTGGIFKNAAFEVLKQEERLMTSGEITKLAMERRLLRCTGKTPENTMASALYTEVRKKANTTVFIKPKEGLFGLKAWLSETWLLSWLAQEGIDVAELQEPSAPEPMPKKVRTSYNGGILRGGGGSVSSHRVSTGGAQLMRSSSAGGGAREPVGGGTVTAGHCLSLNGETMAPGGGGGGVVGRASSFINLGSAAAMTSGGLQRLPYGAGERGGAGISVVAAGMVATTGSNYGGDGGTPADALSSLHLLVDAADEIEHEGVPKCEQPGIHRPPIVRRRSDSLIRTTSFRRQRPPLNRETSLPSMIARVRVRDEFEEEQDVAAAVASHGDEEDEEDLDEEDLDEGDDDAAAAAPGSTRTILKALHQTPQLPPEVAASAAAAADWLPVHDRQDQQLRKYQQLLIQHQRHLMGQHDRVSVAGLMEEVSEDDDGDPQHSDAGGGGGEPKCVRWVGGAEDLGQHPGVYRGLRGGRIAGIRNALTDGGSRPVGPSGLTRTACGSSRRASESNRLAAFTGNGMHPGDVTEDDDDVQDGEGEEGVLEEEGTRGKARELAQQRRRWGLPPRPGSGRRGRGTRGASQQQPPGGFTHRCSSSSRQPADGADGAVPPSPHQHRSPRSLSAAHVPIMQMSGSTLVPLHVLERMPTGAAMAAAAAAAAAAGGLPGNAAAVKAMLAAAGGCHGACVGGLSLPLPEHVMEHLRAGFSSGGFPGLAAMSHAMGLGLTTAQLHALSGAMLSQAPVLGIGLPGLEVGALLGDIPSSHAAAADGGARDCLLPPALMKIATVLGRSPRLSANLVAARRKMTEQGGDAAAAMERDDVADLGSVSGRMKMERDLGRASGEQRGGGRGSRRTAAARRSTVAGEEDWDTAMPDGNADTDADAQPVDKAAPKPCNSSIAAAADVAEIAIPEPQRRTSGRETQQANANAAARSAADGPLSSSAAAAAAAADVASRDQYCSLRGEALLRAPMEVTPVGGPSAASVAVHDAMNSPDSQLVVGSADRTSPCTDDMGHSRGDDSGHSNRTVTVALGGQQYPAETASGPPLPPPPGHALAGPLSQLVLLQQQHLKLLPPVEAARPGDVPDPGSINRIRQQVLDMEARMGSLHRETGRAYVLLARVLEHKGTFWSLSMAERALMRAWTIVSVVGANRRSSDGSGAVAATSDAPPPSGVAEAAAAEASAAAAGEILGQLPDSFHTFQYLLEQIRMKQRYLQQQQEQQLMALVQMVAMLSAPAVSPAPAAGGSIGVGVAPASLAGGTELSGGGPPAQAGAGGDGMLGPPAAAAM
ncbi:hypothetical protein Vafri_16422 [Volvox africanus]|uniref:HTH HARE-type domain-containing protein n=1 Tax=Volvox africanus TaxID=51714 RepID=A0A8J4BND5_9CHLO|nr:hypothetical protein Vafri_16422 [Volvox africanus]